MKYLGKELHISHKIFYDFAQEKFYRTDFPAYLEAC